MRKRRSGEGSRLRTSRGPRQLVTSLRRMMIGVGCRDNRVSPRGEEARVVEGVKGVNDLHLNELLPRVRNRLLLVKADLSNSRGAKGSRLPRRWTLMIQTQTQRMEDLRLQREGGRHLQQEGEGEEVELLRVGGEEVLDLRDNNRVRAGEGEDRPREQGDQIDRVATFLALS